MVRLLSNGECVRILMVLLQFLALAFAEIRKSRSIAKNMSPSNNSFVSAEEDSCQSRSYSYVCSALNVCKLIQNPTRMRCNVSNSFVPIELTPLLHLMLTVFVSPTSDRFQRNYLKQPHSRGNDRSNDNNGSNTNFYLKFLTGQDNSTTHINSLREIETMKNELVCHLHGKTLLTMEDGISMLISDDWNSANHMDIRVKRDLNKQSQGFRKTNQKTEIREEKSITKPTVKKARRLLQVRASGELSREFFEPKAITRDNSAAILANAELNILPKEIESSVNSQIAKVTRVKRDKRTEVKKDGDEQEGNTNVAQKCRGHRAVRSIEEIRELAERLMRKVNELQNYFTLEKNDSKRERDRKRAELRTVMSARDNLLPETLPSGSTVKLCSSSSEEVTGSTSSLGSRLVSKIPDNKMSETANRRQRTSELRTMSSRLKFGSRRKRKSRRKWDRWTDWSGCSVKCGKGRQIRWRYCIRDCDTAEIEMEEKDCQLPACAPSRFLGIF